MSADARTALCCAADIVRWSTRRTPEQLFAQDEMNEVMLSALRSAGLPERIDQTAGDGTLVVAPGDIDPSVVIPDLLYALRVELRAKNALFMPPARVRLRVALTMGLVPAGSLGFGGDTIIRCFRLLNSPPVKEALALLPEADLAVIVSGVLYDDVVRHGFRSPRPEEFRKVRCAPPGTDFAEDAWLYVPGPWTEGAIDI
ncbi:hypothetical protein [Actinomadura sp. SCN-SB]|uniref:hypothetical protein n=1 Tax=Actinomadura sp. SCN-SB TaxID=3373092 RepID=UPI0037505381